MYGALSEFRPGTLRQLTISTYLQRIPHCYTSAAVADAARCWVPCLDALWERCTWELVFIVPRVLSFEQETEAGIEVEEYPIVCVASGELMEQVSLASNADS